MGEPAQEGTMSAKKARQKSNKSTTATGKKSKGFTDDERAAMKERAQELKAEVRRGPRANKEKAGGESDVLANPVIARLVEGGQMEFGITPYALVSAVNYNT
jgi:hypothetical protein